MSASWFILFSHGFRRPPLAPRFIELTPATVAAGLALTVVGLAFAAWARFYMGRNWSAQIELKKDHQLIRTARTRSSATPSIQDSCWQH